MVQALRTSGGFPGLLNGWEQQPDQHPNDADHDEYFDQRIRASETTGHHGSSPTLPITGSTSGGRTSSATVIAISPSSDPPRSVRAVTSNRPISRPADG